MRNCWNILNLGITAEGEGDKNSSALSDSTCYGNRNNSCFPWTPILQKLVESRGGYGSGSWPPGEIHFFIYFHLMLSHQGLARVRCFKYTPISIPLKTLYYSYHLSLVVSKIEA